MIAFPLGLAARGALVLRQYERSSCLRVRDMNPAPYDISHSVSSLGKAASRVLVTAQWADAGGKCLGVGEGFGACECGKSHNPRNPVPHCSRFYNWMRGPDVLARGVHPNWADKRIMKIEYSDTLMRLASLWPR